MTNPKDSRGGRPPPPYREEQSHRESARIDRRPATYRDDDDHEDYKDYPEPLIPRGEPLEYRPSPHNQSQTNRKPSRSARRPATYGEHEDHQDYDNYQRPVTPEGQPPEYQLKPHDRSQTDLARTGGSSTAYLSYPTRQNPTGPVSSERLSIVYNGEGSHKAVCRESHDSNPLQHHADSSNRFPCDPTCHGCQQNHHHSFQNYHRDPRCSRPDCQSYSERQDHRIQDTNNGFNRHMEGVVGAEQRLQARDSFIESLPIAQDRYVIWGEIYESQLMKRRVLEALDELEERYYFAEDARQTPAIKVAIREGLPTQYRESFDEMLMQRSAIWVQVGGTRCEIAKKLEQSLTGREEEIEQGGEKVEDDTEKHIEVESKSANIDEENKGGDAVEDVHLGGEFELIDSAKDL